MWAMTMPAGENTTLKPCSFSHLPAGDENMIRRLSPRSRYGRDKVSSMMMPDSSLKGMEVRVRAYAVGSARDITIRVERLAVAALHNRDFVVWTGHFVFLLSVFGHRKSRIPFQISCLLCRWGRRVFSNTFT